MILPTVINVTVSALHAVPKQQKAASLAMGATRIQTIFKVLLPSARSGIAAAVVLGTGRAIGEAMAITLVSGSSVNMPLPFNSVRFHHSHCCGDGICCGTPQTGTVYHWAGVVCLHYVH